MKKLTVATGKRFNKLTVMEVLDVNEKGFSTARCKCECGGEVVVKIPELRSGHKKSCGCSTWKSRGDIRDRELVGKKFSRLTVLKLIGSDNRKYRLCECICDCGQKVKIRIARMVAGELQSCGCLQLEKAMENLAVAQKVSIIHGLSGTLTGRSWLAMIQRCFNPRCEQYHRYGSVGILPCEFIQSSPLNLVCAIGERPAAFMSLDRIDNDGGYWCGQCADCIEHGWPLNIRWATASEQALNRCSTRLVEIDGVIKSASEWCKLLGLSPTSKQIYTYPKHET